MGITDIDRSSWAEPTSIISVNDTTSASGYTYSDHIPYRRKVLTKKEKIALRAKKLMEESHRRVVASYNTRLAHSPNRAVPVIRIRNR